MMPGEERRKRAYEIRKKNLEAKKKAERKKKFMVSDRFMFIFGGIIVFLIAILLFAITSVLANRNKTSDIEIKESIVESSIAETDSVNTTLSSQIQKVNYPKEVTFESENKEILSAEPKYKVLYQNLTFTKINVREKPDMGANIIGQLEQNSPVDVLNHMGDWCEILYNESPAYVKSDYIGDELGYKKYNAKQEVAFVNLNVRTSPNKDEDNVAFKLDEGEFVQVVAESENGDWVQVIQDDKLYWIAQEYVGNEQEYKAYQDSLDKTPYSDYLVSKWGFSKDLQKFLYEQCKEGYPSDPVHYYAFLLGTMQQESDLGNDRSHWNKNGSRDLGIMQVNSVNWPDLKKKGIISSYDLNSLTCDELQYNDYICIRAGMSEMNICVANHGISENAYYSYNTGKHKTKGTNTGSALVWGYYKEWCNRLGI